MSVSKKEMDKIPFRNNVISKLTDKQKKIAKVAPPYDRITGADFKKLKQRKNANS
tara:strand:+ start:202 stop:366 length:165 start_codon:yes stop_codon:yes gene_type:complete